MRIMLAAMLGATTLAALPVAPAMAQTPREANREYRRDVRDAQREYREDVRGADSRRDVREARREYRDNVRDARKDRREDVRRYTRYDYNRPEPGQRRYYADRYYREGNYRPRALGRNDRIYRGNDNRYYCRRNDGSTGLIVGGLAGGALGNVIAGGGSRLLGTLIGAGGGALLGQQVDRGRVVCR